MAKADAMLTILLMLSRGRKVTARQIAGSLEVNLRTVYRYIDSLCASGVPIVAEAGPQGGYSLPDSVLSMPLFFTRDQTVALFQAALVAQAANPPQREPLRDALDRLRHHLPPAQADAVERHTAGLVVVPADGARAVHPWLELLESCVADRVTVEISYLKPGAPQAEIRKVDPHRLLYASGRWYLHAYCHDRQESRDFRVDRIRGLARTEATFQPLPDLNPGGRYDDSWIHAQVLAEPRTSVCLQGEPSALTSICEHWYWRHCVIERREREASLLVDPVGMQHLPQSLLYHGINLTVVSPDSLRRAVADLARMLAEHHG